MGDALHTSMRVPSKTELMFRTIHTVIQLSIFGAVASWCVTYPSQVEADAAGVDGSATHDTINSLLSDAGSGRGRIELLNSDGVGKPGHQYSQDTHYQ